MSSSAPVVPVLSSFCLAEGGIRVYGHDHACFRPRGHDPGAMHQCWCGAMFPVDTRQLDSV